MVEDCETGLLFTPFSAADLRKKIEYLFDCDDESARMGRAARAKAEREYSASSHLARLMNVYQATLGAGAYATSA
jgi:glycosyltransferase involved in cell wall biosynthesis